MEHQEVKHTEAAVAPAEAVVDFGTDSAISSTAPLDPTGIYTTFETMNLKTELLRGVFGYGFEEPSIIQRKGIVPIVVGRDVLGQAQSGTGKTGTFSIGILQRVDVAVKQLQAIVLAPTHELARQIYDVMSGIGSKTGISIHVAVGGTMVRDDTLALRAGCQILIGTPGRIFDLFSRKAASSAAIQTIVIDEADQMLERNFQTQIIDILGTGFPDSTQICLFSATMPADVVDFAEKLMRNPVRLLVTADQVTLEGIKQYQCCLEREEYKFEALCDIYRHFTISQAIIFCNQKKKAEWLAAKMKDAGFTLEHIHGELDSADRKRRMEDFRAGKVRVLIGTDLIARGIDVQQVSVVINYDLPLQRENYIHRIGRCGRYGKKGVAINLLTTADEKVMREIEAFYSTKVNDLPQDFNSIRV
jgi:translation initiation factor 4A